RIATLEKKGKGGTSNGNDVPAHVRCFECQGNHYANNCPNKKQGMADSKSKGGNSVKSWRRTRPTAGGTTTKIVDGQTYMWCEHCRRWTLTHSTNEHRGKKFGNRTPRGGGTALAGNLADGSSTAETEITSNLSFMGYA
ncbi:MAG: hypothetical protein ACREOZ_01800, partial [Gloeomargaritales cyanobacterium]